MPATSRIGDSSNSNGVNEPMLAKHLDGKYDGVTMDNTSPVVRTALYPKRFLMLFLFVIYSGSNSFQWIEYSVIMESVMKYYGVSMLWANWTSTIYCIMYIPFVFPATWLMERKGLRYCVILGALGTCLGSWIKVFSVHQNRFFLVMIGQTIVASSQIFILSVPPRLAAVWFGATEVSRACAVGVFGNQLGIALGFLIPPLLVTSTTDVAVIQHGMHFLVYGIALITALNLVAILICFNEKPPLPPSLAMLAQEEAELNGYWTTLRNLLSNSNYLLLLISYGINVGVFYAVSTLLNQVVLGYFPGQQTVVGYLGLVMVAAGMVGSVICGILLDVTHKFKEVTLGVYFLTAVSMLLFTFIMQTRLIWTAFLVTILLGFFMTGYLPIGFEFASEITYPEPEGTSSGLLNASAQIFGIIFTFGGTWVFENYRDIWTNSILSGALIVGTILTAFTKSDLRRQAHNQQSVRTDMISQPSDV